TPPVMRTVGPELAPSTTQTGVSKRVPGRRTWLPSASVVLGATRSESETPRNAPRIKNRAIMSQASALRTTSAGGGTPPLRDLSKYAERARARPQRADCRKAAGSRGRGPRPSGAPRAKDLRGLFIFTDPFGSRSSSKGRSVAHGGQPVAARRERH